MEKKNILVTLPVSGKQKTELETAYPEGRFAYRTAPCAADVKEAEIILGDVPLKFLKNAPKLQWIQLSSSGADHCTKPGVLKPGVLLTSSTGAFGLAISEYLLAGTLALFRNFNRYFENQEKREWKAAGDAVTIDGSRTLIIGLGSIGGDYGRKMKALGSYVVGIRRHSAHKPAWLDEMFDLSSLETELPKADIVAMSLPNTPETTHLMDGRKLGLMKKSAILLNAGRGSAIVTDDLCRALQEGRIAGACLDVTDPEPLPPDHPLWSAGNILITPHISGQIRRKYDEIFQIMHENLRRYGKGEPLLNQIDFHTGYRKFQ